MICVYKIYKKVLFKLIINLFNLDIGIVYDWSLIKYFNNFIRPPKTRICPKPISNELLMVNGSF